MSNRRFWKRSSKDKRKTWITQVTLTRHSLRPVNAVQLPDREYFSSFFENKTQQQSKMKTRSFWDLFSTKVKNDLPETGWGVVLASHEVLCSKWISCVKTISVTERHVLWRSFVVKWMARINRCLIARWVLSLLRAWTDIFFYLVLFGGVKTAVIKLKGVRRPPFLKVFGITFRNIILIKLVVIV